MDELDLTWMSAGVRRIFGEGVRLYAKAIRDGAVLQMQDGAQAMQRASQLHIAHAFEAKASEADPAI